MRKYISYLAAAALAFGGAGLLAPPAEAQERQYEAEAEVQVDRDRDQDRVEVDAQRDRDQAVDADQDRGLTDRLFDRTPEAATVEVSPGEANNIRGTLATATEAALTEGQLRSLAQRLTTSDEARLAEDFGRDQPELDPLIRQIRQVWEQRYGEDFNIRDREAAYPPAVVQIHRGLTRDAVLAAERRGAEDLRDREALRDEDRERELRQEVDQQREGLAREEREPREEARVDDDAARVEYERREVHEPARPAAARDMAAIQENLVTVIFDDAHELHGVHVPLVNEGTVFDAWRIDIPLHVDAMTIRRNLERNFSKALERQAEWPADVNEAYRMATHIVMLSLYDVGREKHDGEHQRDRAEAEAEADRMD